LGGEEGVQKIAEDYARKYVLGFFMNNTPARSRFIQGVVNQLMRTNECAKELGYYAIAGVLTEALKQSPLLSLSMCELLQEECVLSVLPTALMEYDSFVSEAEEPVRLARSIAKEQRRREPLAKVVVDELRKRARIAIGLPTLRQWRKGELDLEVNGMPWGRALASTDEERRLEEPWTRELLMMRKFQLILLLSEAHSRHWVPVPFSSSEPGNCHKRKRQDHVGETDAVFSNPAKKTPNT